MEIPPAWQTKSYPPLHRGALIPSPTEHLHISLNDKNPDLHIHCKSGFSIAVKKKAGHLLYPFMAW